MRSSTVSFAVRNRMGAWLPSARNRESTVSPSMSGSMTSSTTTSGSCSRMTLSARCPSGATLHVPPLVPQRHRQQVGERVLVVDDDRAHR